MLWTLGVILLILRLLGLMIAYTMGGFIQRGSAWLSPFRSDTIFQQSPYAVHSAWPVIRRRHEE